MRANLVSAAASTTQPYSFAFTEEFDPQFVEALRTYSSDIHAQYPQMLDLLQRLVQAMEEGTVSDERISDLLSLTCTQFGRGYTTLCVLFCALRDAPIRLRGQTPVPVAEYIQMICVIRQLILHCSSKKLAESLWLGDDFSAFAQIPTLLMHLSKPNFSEATEPLILMSLASIDSSDRDLFKQLFATSSCFRNLCSKFGHALGLREAPASTLAARAIKITMLALLNLKCCGADAARMRSDGFANLMLVLEQRASIEKASVKVIQAFTKMALRVLKNADTFKTNLAAYQAAFNALFEALQYALMKKASNSNLLSIVTPLLTTLFLYYPLGLLALPTSLPPPKKYCRDVHVLMAVLSLNAFFPQTWTMPLLENTFQGLRRTAMPLLPDQTGVKPEDCVTIADCARYHKASDKTEIQFAQVLVLLACLRKNRPFSTQSPTFDTTDAVFPIEKVVKEEMVKFLITLFRSQILNLVQFMALTSQQELLGTLFDLRRDRLPGYSTSRKTITSFIEESKKAPLVAQESEGAGYEVADLAQVQVPRTSSQQSAAAAGLPAPRPTAATGMPVVFSAQKIFAHKVVEQQQRREQQELALRYGDIFGGSSSLADEAAEARTILTIVFAAEPADGIELMHALISDARNGFNSLEDLHDRRHCYMERNDDCYNIHVLNYRCLYSLGLEGRTIVLCAYADYGADHERTKTSANQLLAQHFYNYRDPNRIWPRDKFSENCLFIIVALQQNNEIVEAESEKAKEILRTTVEEFRYAPKRCTPLGDHSPLADHRVIGTRVNAEDVNSAQNLINLVIDKFVEQRGHSALFQSTHTSEPGVFQVAGLGLR